MSLQSVLAPVFVQVGLMFALTLAMIAARRGLVACTPERTKLFGDSYANQFELPVLFFALVPLAILTRKADLLFVAMSWIFVVSRVVHAAIHTGSNTQPARRIAWFVGIGVLLVMWIVFALRILLATP